MDLLGAAKILKYFADSHGWYKPQHACKCDNPGCNGVYADPGRYCRWCKVVWGDAHDPECALGLAMETVKNYVESPTDLETLQKMYADLLLKQAKTFKENLDLENQVKLLKDNDDRAEVRKLRAELIDELGRVAELTISSDECAESMHRIEEINIDTLTDERNN